MIHRRALVGDQEGGEVARRVAGLATGRADRDVIAGRELEGGGAMLAKLLPAPWHCAQLLAMFTWFMTETL